MYEPLKPEPIVGIIPNAQMAKTLHICWMIHNQCNHKCSYCHEVNWGGSHTWLNYDHVIKFLDKLFAHYDKTKDHYLFSFTGGEPTIWPKFFDLCEYLKDKGCFIGLTTNASRRNQFFERAKNYFNFIAVSYHPEFSKDDVVLENIKTLGAYSNVGIRVMMHKDPELWKKSVNFAEKIKALKGDPPLSMEYVPLLKDFGTANPTPDSYEEWQMKFFDENPYSFMEDKTKKFNRPKDHLNDISILYKDGTRQRLVPMNLVQEDRVNFKDWSCNIGLDQIFIDEKGEILPAGCRVGKKIGHIFDEYIAFPTKPVVCTKTYCHCTTDIMTTKFSPDYAKAKRQERVNSIIDTLMFRKKKNNSPSTSSKSL